MNDSKTPGNHRLSRGCDQNRRAVPGSVRESAQVRRMERNNPSLQAFGRLPRCRPMLKKLLPLFLAPLLLAGCQTTLTNLTPTTRVRNADNLYMVEVAFASSQQTLRWDSIKPQIMVGNEFYPMRPTQLMTNRWEGLLPVAPNASS